MLKDWLEEKNYRRQRAERGWSDKDLWATGEYIAEITSGMLKELRIVNGEKWFKKNIAGKSNRTLQSLINDIDNYLLHLKTNWSDGLETTVGEDGSTVWINSTTGRKISKYHLNGRIRQYHAESLRLEKKANKAMAFFGSNFASFWT